MPGIGDAIGGLLSTWILFQGMRVRAPWFTLMQMVMNVAVEVVVGFIPLLGDLFLTLMQSMGVERDRFAAARRNMNEFLL